MGINALGPVRLRGESGRLTEAEKYLLSCIVYRAENVTSYFRNNHTFYFLISHSAQLAL